MGPDWLRTFEGVEPMGRGRAKAKQVKVARELKYKRDDTGLDRLRAELAGSDSRNGTSVDDYDDDHEESEDESDEDEDDWRLLRGNPGIPGTGLGNL
jgi:Protein of unknown function (DUF3073)